MQKPSGDCVVPEQRARLLKLAILSLDAAVPSNWTEEGLPSIGQVVKMLPYLAPSSSEVTTTLPGYCRRRALIKQNYVDDEYRKFTPNLIIAEHHHGD